jgi:TDG/mug DNA glycosylase family protein
LTPARLKGLAITMLPDLLVPGLKLVVCGSAAGAVSAARGEYYAGPGNKFWPTLHQVGLTARRLAPHEYCELLSYGIGLTDVAKDQAGNDAAIDFCRSDPAGLRSKVHRFSPLFLVCNGKKAAQVFLGRPRIAFGLQPETIGPTRLFVAPSTSGAASGFWDIGIWQDLAQLVRGAAL